MLALPNANSIACTIDSYSPSSQKEWKQFLKFVGNNLTHNDEYNDDGTDTESIVDDISQSLCLKLKSNEFEKPYNL